MAFTTFDRAEHARTARRDKQGPPKLTVTQSASGRTTVFLSGAVRDYLGPSTVRNGKAMRVSLLVDLDARMIAIKRVPQDFDADESYEVRGLGANGTAYFTEWKLAEAIGLLPGVYPASLVHLRGEGVAVAAVIKLDDRQPPEQKKRRDKLAVQIETILAIRDEGITLIE